MESCRDIEAYVEADPAPDAWTKLASIGDDSNLINLSRLWRIGKVEVWVMVTARKPSIQL